MEKTFFVIFLLTGFCEVSVSSTWYYYFIKKNTTYDNAFLDCVKRFDEFYTIQSMRMNTFLSDIAKEKTEKIWVGVRARTLPWTGMDGQPVKYSNWKFLEPNGDINQLCASMGSDGEWLDLSCSSLRQSVCFNESHYSLTETEMTWMDAAAHCEAKNSSLVQIRSSQMNDETVALVSHGTEVWIGFNRSVDWYREDTEESATFLNWQEGQPDNLNGDERCAAMVVQNGTWTDERCTETYSYFCKKQGTSEGQSSNDKDETKVKKSTQMVVKLKMQTTANMEDPDASASLEQQLRALLAKQGVTGFKLTWRKLPEKET